MSTFKTQKSILCLLLVALLIFSYVPRTFAAFEGSAWAEKEVNEAIDLGLIPEDMQNNYTKNITRAEFCRLTVVLLENIYEATIEDILSQRELSIDSAVFTDTQDTDILAANALGIVFGDGKGIFNPDGEIKRGEAAAMLMRTTSLTGDYSALPHVFDDASWFPAWARESAYTAYAYGIMVGDTMNRFHPVSFYTRQETYVTILRLYHAIQDGAKQQEALYPMSAKNKEGLYLWGYINQHGTFAIEPKYAYASEWNGKYGIVSLPDESDAHLVIDREENHVIEVNELRELLSERNAEKTPPRFFGNTLYVGGYDRALFSLPDGKWLAADYKGGYAFPIMGGIIKAYDGFSHVVYYLDRNGQTVIPREEWYIRGGDFYKGVVMLETEFLSVDEIYLWQADGGKKLNIGNETFRYYYFESVGDLMIFTKEDSDNRELYGVFRADGKEILPPDYETLSLTKSKQILARKNPEEPYNLFDENGKKIYEFDSNFDGELLFDSIGYYMFPAEDTMLTVLSNAGTVTANIEMAQDASFRFVNGLILIKDENGACQYYTVNGDIVFEAEEQA